MTLQMTNRNSRRLTASGIRSTCGVSLRGPLAPGYCTLVALLLLAASTRAAEPNQFRFHKDIERTDTARENLAALPFDADVYAAARDGFPDVRVFDSAGGETPFLIEKATQPRTRTTRAGCAFHTPSLKTQDDGLEIVVQLDRDSPPADGLAIFTPLANYERRVRVFGGNDGTDWTPLVADGLVFDYSRYMDVSNREIRLPKNGFRWFKIVVSGISDTKESPFLELTRKYRGGGESERIEKTVLERRPFRIDRIEFWNDKTETFSEHEKQVDCPVAILGVEENAKEKTTTIDVSARRAPIVQLTLETTSRNFSRAVEVRRYVAEKPSENGSPRQVPPPIALASGRVTSVEFGGYRNRSLDIGLPELREARYRIVIHNEDNPPLKITGVKGRGPQYRAVFLAAAGERYRLAYGAENVGSPRYDAVAVLNTLRREGNRPIECRLGAEVAGPVAAVESTDSALKSLLNNPVFLGGAIVVLVIVLGWAMFRAARRINEIPKED